MLSQTRICGVVYQSNNILNPNDIRVYDYHYAICNTTGIFPIWTTAGYAYLTNFGFTIPDGATISGLTVTFIGFASQKTGEYTGPPTRIVRAGFQFLENYTSIVGDYKFTPTIETSQTTYYVGSSADPWGRTWTPAELNADGFGIYVGAQFLITDSQALTAYLDYVDVTVYYTVANTSVAISGKYATAARGIPSRSGSATRSLTGHAATSNRTAPAAKGIGTVSVIGRSSYAGKGETLASSLGAGMFLWTWSYGIDAYWHEVLGSLIPESGGFPSGLYATCSRGTVVATTDAQVLLTGLEATASIGAHIGYSYAEAFITGVHVHSAVGNVSPSAHGDVNVPIVGRYATASIGTLIAAGTSVGFASGVWLLYPVTIFVEQQWQCDVEVSEVHNV